MRIALVGPSRFGLGEPHAGGLEAFTATLARALHTLGHTVTVFAGPVGAPHQLPVEVVPVISRQLGRVDRLDTSNPRWFARHEDESYAATAAAVCDPRRFDVVHNNSLHRRLVDVDVPGLAMVHTVHCPPFDPLLGAHQRLRARKPDRRVVAVSGSLATQWHGLPTDVTHNGVDLDRWWPDATTSRGGCVWAGRLIADKGPHLAIDAARSAGRHLVLAGPVHDERYFDAEVVPRLGADAVWIGPAVGDELRRCFAAADVGVVTPMWAEPFGLVPAEMLACGLPVAAFDNGAIREFTVASVCRYATQGDVPALADAIRAAADLDRNVCRAHAAAHLGVMAMATRYVDLYRSTRPAVSTVR